MYGNELVLSRAYISNNSTAHKKKAFLTLFFTLVIGIPLLKIRIFKKTWSVRRMKNMAMAFGIDVPRRTFPHNYGPNPDGKITRTL